MFKLLLDSQLPILRMWELSCIQCCDICQFRSCILNVKFILRLKNKNVTFKLCSESSLSLHYTFLHFNIFFLTTHIMCFEPPHLSRIAARLRERKRRILGLISCRIIYFSPPKTSRPFLGPCSLVLNRHRGLSSCDVVESGTDHPPP